jgi:FtsP/CotA-like multicopper oxidase with cupredoxin domain
MSQFMSLYLNLYFAHYWQPGTYLYHAHYGMQREAGLYGSIRVSLPDGEKEPFAYDYDRSIILNDWYHKSTYEQATGLSSIPFVWVGEPQVNSTTSTISVCKKLYCSYLD